VSLCKWARELRGWRILTISCQATCRYAPGRTPRKILSKPIEELEVKRRVEAGLKHSFCHVRPVIRLTGLSAVPERNFKGARHAPAQRDFQKVRAAALPVDYFRTARNCERKSSNSRLGIWATCFEVGNSADATAARKPERALARSSRMALCSLARSPQASA
jgi:hypothetical protein